MTINPLYQKKIVDTISKYLPECSIYLYGSRARQTHASGSDVDIALDNKTPIKASILANIRADLDGTTIPLMIDIVDAHAIDNDFLMVIKKDWITWKK